MHRVNEEAFKQSFSWAAADTEAQGASMELRITSIRARCQVCHSETESDDPVVACGRCGALSFDVVQGSEMILESIEYENTSCAQ